MSEKASGDNDNDDLEDGDKNAVNPDSKLERINNSAIK